LLPGCNGSAEDRSEQSFALNAEFPGRLPQWTKEKGIPPVHYPKNHVSDGSREKYHESDAPRLRCLYVGGLIQSAAQR
jgi:dTDP-4-dehydrorhamnose reductase